MPTDAPTPANPAPYVNAQCIKPGHRTTEFWIVVAMIVVDLALGITEKMPGQKAAMYASWLAMGYGALRTLKKAWLGTLGMTALADVNFEPNGRTGTDGRNVVETTGGTPVPRLSDDEMVNRVRHGSAGMGTLAALCILGGLALLAAVFLSGCASTNVYRGGQKILSTQADAAQLEFRDGNTSLKVVGLNHSTPTRAGGSVVGTAGTAAAAIIAQGVIR